MKIKSNLPFYLGETNHDNIKITCNLTYLGIDTNSLAYSHKEIHKRISRKQFLFFISPTV